MHHRLYPLTFVKVSFYFLCGRVFAEPHNMFCWVLPVMIVRGVNKISWITLHDEARTVDALRMKTKYVVLWSYVVSYTKCIELSNANVSRLNFRCRIEWRINNRYPADEFRWIYWNRVAYCFNIVRVTFANSRCMLMWMSRIFALLAYSCIVVILLIDHWSKNKSYHLYFQ